MRLNITAILSRWKFGLTCWKAATSPIFTILNYVIKVHILNNFFFWKKLPVSFSFWNICTKLLLLRQWTLPTRDIRNRVCASLKASLLVYCFTVNTSLYLRFFRVPASHWNPSLDSVRISSCPNIRALPLTSWTRLIPCICFFQPHFSRHVYFQHLFSSRSKNSTSPCNHIKNI